MSLVVLALLAASPCAPPPPAREEAAPEVIAAYLSTGDEELAAGRPSSSALAYGRALRLAPADPAARAGLSRACAAWEAEATRAAVAALEARRPREALEVLAPFLDAPAAAQPATALAAGLALEDVGEKAGAARWLARAAEARALLPAAATLLAADSLEAGDTGAARARLSALPADAPDSAVRLRRLVAREGRLMTAVSAGLRADSNVDVAPGTTAFPSGSADVGAAATAMVLARPLGQTGPFLGVDASLRKWAQLTAWDDASGAATAGAQLVLSPLVVSAAYRLTLEALGWQPYLLAHAAQVDVRLRLGRWQPGVAWSLQATSFAPAAVQGYSGLTHQGRVFLGASLSPVRLSAAYEVLRDVTTAPEYWRFEHGPALDADLALGDRWRLWAGAALGFRAFDHVDPDLGVARQELTVGVRGRAEVDVADWVTVFLSVEWRLVSSDVAELSYSRVAGTVGVALAVGAL